MKKLLLVLGSLLCLNLLYSHAQITQNGDTVIVQTFSFGSPQDAWFVFPSDTVRFEKILMKYTLKCNPAQSPACGEWDYLTYTYLYKNTGEMDSTLMTQATYTINGSSPDSIQYMNTPSYSYKPTWQYYIVHDNTTSLNTYPVGAGNLSKNLPFGASNAVSKAQYLWKASELNAAGLSAGNITGLQFYVQSSGSELRNLKIRIAATSQDSLTSTTAITSGFTTVYLQNTQFMSAGWNSIQLTSPFNWNGTSNLVIEICYDNNQAGNDNIITSDSTTYKSGLFKAGNDRVAAFHSNGYIDVPMNNNISGIDSSVTISFWAYGDPALQPMDGTAFEAVDSLGNRLLNSHLPWSDGNVYWDAGFSGTSYDRINRITPQINYKGTWTHWAFTKDAATGIMKIYMNGTMWKTGSAKTKLMNGIRKFRIGKGNWNGSQTYEGKIDEFAVFNTALSQATIQAYMNKFIDASHPNYSNLAAYYQFDDGNYQTSTDVSPGNHNPAVHVSVANPLKSSTELNNLNETFIRPNLQFEQGVYTSHLDSTLVIDSIQKTPIQIIVYNDSVNNPGVATDTLFKWPSYYTYTYNAQGVITDSSLVSPDSTIYKGTYTYYNRFPKTDRYELARYITPYGNGLSLGNGWSWTFDVSDYRTLLADSVHLNAGNWQELLDVKFYMIKGIPPRDIINIRNLWNGGFNYGQTGDPIESHLQALNVSIPANSVTSRWKSRITGHGMDTPQNCAEFCAKNHYFKVNGTNRYTKLVWRDNCDLNPLYPQGGTWVYDRANWCPGAEVWTYDWELTPFVTPGNNTSLDHDVQAYTNTSGWDYYQIEDQLVTYGAPNFTLDAAVEDILSPSTDQMYQRYNPVCTNPIIKIKNTGSANLTSLTISYGLNGGTPSTYNWTGNLKFMEIATVTLGNFAWVPGATKFDVSVSNPNGGTDQYSNNNAKSTLFTYPPVIPSQFIVELKTNNSPGENEYVLKDDGGNIVFERNNLSANTTYKDTITLTDGCYEFELVDYGEDGLSWWANTAQGSGYLKFRNVNNTIIKNYNSDFGGKVYQQFTVGLVTSTEKNSFTTRNELSVYPNPNDGHVYINIDLTERKDGKVEICDLLGKSLRVFEFKNQSAESIEADLSDLKSGVYIVTLRTGNDVITKKMMKQ